MRWLAVLLLSAPLLYAAEPLAERWTEPYEGAEASGPEVLGYWRFETGAELKDASGKGHDLRLEGAALTTQGRVGGALESFPNDPPKNDKHHAAVAANAAGLSPAGAFTIELWLKPKAELAQQPQVFLLDKKYVAQADYQMTLDAPDKTGARRVVVNLGFGADSERYTSEAAMFEPEVWHHLAFTYDGAGTGRFFRDGSALGEKTALGRGAVTPGKHTLSIGDRIGSTYRGFPGFLDEVRITRGAREFRPAVMRLTAERAVFVRMEPSPEIELQVRNALAGPLRGATATLQLEGTPAQTFDLPELASGAVRTVKYKFDTTLRPDEYRLHGRLEIAGEHPYRSEESFALMLVPRPLPHRMPVVMWGIGGIGAVLKELPRLQEIGFTHCLGLETDYGAIWKAGQATAPEKPENVALAKRMLDTALAHDLHIIAQLSPGSWARGLPEWARVDRKGKPYAKEDVCGLFPRLQEFCEQVGQSMTQTYGAYPAFAGALLHSETRGEGQLCFHEHDRAVFRAATGLEIPGEAVNKNGVDYTKLAGFPADHVIPDDAPLYRYFQWYWKDGDGWNGLNHALHVGLKHGARPDFWTFTDPAVRCPSVYGSGGGADFISQWTYSYPDPIRLGLSTDELFAMAAGSAAKQGVMKMTQIIWYRSQTAPVGKTAASSSPWEDTDAAFLTIAPMQLREAFWTKMARPVQGIMYHGWQSLVSTESTGSYRYTHPETQHELQRLLHGVVEPLGPALMQVPDRPSDVAYLESFASQMYAHRGTYGWNNGWGGDAYQVLAYAHLQPEVIYDETVRARGLEGFKVLVMTDCDVLTATVVEKVRAFQKAGGLVIADERLCPALKADILLPSVTRTGKADEDKSALLASAAKLGHALEGRYRRYVDSTNPEIVTRARRSGDAEYVFVVNDSREYGTYVGQYGKVMENGLPSRGTVRIERKEGVVYDLRAGRAVETKPKNGGLEWDVELGPGEGGVYLVSPAVTGVTVEHSAPVGKSGGSLPLTVHVQGGAAVYPMEVRIFDPDGREAEFSGYYGAVNGELYVPFSFAPNDTPGVWRIRARELASGKQAEVYVKMIRDVRESKR